MKYIVYILFSKSKQGYYTGLTNDLHKRLSEHNSGRCGSTKGGIPWIVLFQQGFDCRKDAHSFEVQIKKRGARRFLENRGDGPAETG